jgi:hypothetical protein
MIVGGAFFKLPEILEASVAQGREAIVIRAMATAVVIELNRRNIEHPTKRVVVEKPFGTFGLSSSYLADLYVHLSGAVKSSPQRITSKSPELDGGGEAISEPIGSRPAQANRSPSSKSGR